MATMLLPFFEGDTSMEPTDKCRDKKTNAKDDRKSPPAESRPTPGSAEGERDVRTQSQSNVPRRGDDGPD